MNTQICFKRKIEKSKDVFFNNPLKINYYCCKKCERLFFNASYTDI